MDRCRGTQAFRVRELFRVSTHRIVLCSANRSSPGISFRSLFSGLMARFPWRLQIRCGSAKQGWSFTSRLLLEDHPEAHKGLFVVDPAFFSVDSHLQPDDSFGHADFSVGIRNAA